MTTMAPRKKSLLGASNPVVQDPGFLPALSSNLAALGLWVEMGWCAGEQAPKACTSAARMHLDDYSGSRELPRFSRSRTRDGTATLGTAAGRRGAKGAQGQHGAGTPVDGSSAPVVGSLGPWCSPLHPLQCPASVDPLQIDCSIEETERKLAQASAESKTPTNKHAKHATAFFIMGLKQLAESGDLRGQPEMFTVSELFGNNTNGFVKVPPSLVSQFSTSIPATPGLFPSDSLDSLTSPVDAPSNGFPFPPTAPSLSDDESFRKKHIQETLDAERKYVADLEVMHEYARELIQKNVVDADTVHHLFPGLGKLLDFGRRFLIEMEGTAQCPWEDQRWLIDSLITCEEFAVYEPYCANYTNASELMLSQEQNLMGTWSLCLDYSRYFFRLYSVPIALLGTFNSMDLDTRSQPSYHRSLFLNGTSGICYAYIRYPTQSAIPTSQSTPILSPTNALDSQTPSLNYLVLRALAQSFARQPLNYPFPVHVGGGGGVSDDSGDPHVRGAPRIGSVASGLDRPAPHLNLARPAPIMDPPGLGPSCPPSHLSRLGQSERSARRLNDMTTPPRIVATEQIRGTSLARHFRRGLVGACFHRRPT
ncbi:CDC24 Calponin [Rhizoctonia solani]|uniref:CDC24 Calponin n=1 Tax=Rhizoctonia solani TaxID=456999 RepID=A0A8H7I1B8_9AGAM|nr:CDC24 Calponin [Rhizoctonia solani]